MKTFNRKQIAITMASALIALPLSAFAVLPAGFGQTLNLDLKPANIASFSVSLMVPVTGGITGNVPCPGLGEPVKFAPFTSLSSFNFVGTNDLINFYNANNVNILQISHARINSHTSALDSGGNVIPGRDILTRQDFTRIKDNPNGIDNTTGIRHYLGLYVEENQQSGVDSMGNPVYTVTSQSQGVMTLYEPLSFPSDANGISTGLFPDGSPVPQPYVDLGFTPLRSINYIGPQPAWLEPAKIFDARTCGYLASGKVAAVDSKWNFTCAITPKDNIYSCPVNNGNAVVPVESKATFNPQGKLITKGNHGGM